MLTLAAEERTPPRTPRPNSRGAARIRFPARANAASWPATEHPREVVLERLTTAPFVANKANSQQIRAAGVRLLLDWLADQPGGCWQHRWAASGAGPASAAWRQVTSAWLREHGRFAPWRLSALSGALVVAIGADLIRPSMPWLVSGATGKGLLVRAMTRGRDPAGFARLRALCDADPDISESAAKLILHRGAEILAAKGGTLIEITIGDVLELLDAERDVHTSRATGTAVFYRILHRMGIFGDTAPATLSAVRTLGQRTPEELIDRYQLICGPVRDVLVDYLRERQPALDYTSLESLAHYLGKRFWADIEHHHPGIDSMHLPTDVADAWKQRLRTKTAIVRTATGEKTEINVPRISYRQSLTPVRAFYLDLAHWPAPANGCPSCQCWSPPSTGDAGKRHRWRTPLDMHDPARRSPPPGRPSSARPPRTRTPTRCGRRIRQPVAAAI